MCLTFAESVENHVGNQQIGDRSEVGWTSEQLRNLSDKLKLQGVECECIELNSLLNGFECKEDGVVLVIKRCVQEVFGEDTQQLFQHLESMEWDKHYWDMPMNDEWYRELPCPWDIFDVEKHIITENLDMIQRSRVVYVQLTMLVEL